MVKCAIIPVKSPPVLYVNIEEVPVGNDTENGTILAFPNDTYDAVEEFIEFVAHADWLDDSAQLAVPINEAVTVDADIFVTINLRKDGV